MSQAVVCNFLVTVWRKPLLLFSRVSDSNLWRGSSEPQWVHTPKAVFLKYHAKRLFGIDCIFFFPDQVLKTALLQGRFKYAVML